MNVVKKSVALIVAVASLSSVSVVLASVDYENTTGQSAQLNKIMQNLPSNEALNQDGWRNQKVRHAFSLETKTRPDTQRLYKQLTCCAFREHEE